MAARCGVNSFGFFLLVLAFLAPSSIYLTVKQSPTVKWGVMQPVPSSGIPAAGKKGSSGKPASVRTKALPWLTKINISPEKCPVVYFQFKANDDNDSGCVYLTHSIKDEGAFLTNSQSTTKRPQILKNEEKSLELGHLALRFELLRPA